MVHKYLYEGKTTEMEHCALPHQALNVINSIKAKKIFFKDH